MKRYIGRTFKSILCAVLILSLSGCWNSRELDDIGIVMGVGVDKVENGPNRVRLTAQLVKPGEIGSPENGGGGGQENPFWNAQSTGKTVFGAVSQLTDKSSRELFFPHTEVLIFGRSAAEDGIQNYIDYFERDHEWRGTVLVMVADGTAEDILQAKSELEDIPAGNIAVLVEGYAKNTSQVMETKLSDLMIALMSGTQAPVMPIVRVSGIEGKEVVEISGTAVFRKDKFVGKLDEAEGRGLLWVLGEVKSGIIEVKDLENECVSSEIIRTTGKVTPELKDGKLTMKVKIKEEGNLGEECGSEDLTKPFAVAYLEDRLAAEIRDEVTAALKKARELDADIFGFGEAVKRRYPKEWKEIEGNWDELFRNLDVELIIDTNIRLMGKINKPSVPE